LITLKRRIKIALEYLLEALPSRPAEWVSNRATATRAFLTRFYPKYKWLRTLISAFNFIIVRSNGSRFIEFELSNICNARCVFCPYPDMLRTEKKFMHMQADTLTKVKECLTHFKGTLISFTPTTGDTLLHPEWDTYMQEIIGVPTVSRATMFTNAIELDDDGCRRLIAVIDADKKGKLSQIYFSVGGYDASTYKALYQVDRFDKVISQIRQFIKQLHQTGKAIGVHIHIKLIAGATEDLEKAAMLFNPGKYPFVYYSHSHQYFSNDAYTRNALLQYYPSETIDSSKACAYLNKTRFAADGGIWADGCVISEMPGDSSLKLGQIDDDFSVIQQRRQTMIRAWEQDGIKPKPCQGCTMYRA